MNKKNIIVNSVLGLGIIGTGVFGYNQYDEKKAVQSENEKLNSVIVLDKKQIGQLEVINLNHEKAIKGYKTQLNKFKINVEKKERKIKKLNKSLNESHEELSKLKLEVKRIEALRRAELSKAKIEKVSNTYVNKDVSVKKQVTTTSNANTQTSKNNTQTTSGGYNQTFQASFYTAHAASTGKSSGDSGYGVTASGTTVQTGRTIACPPSYPFGTKIELEGYGVRVCEDRGGAIQGNRIDIYVSTESEAYSLGRKSIRGRVLN